MVDKTFEENKLSRLEPSFDPEDKSKGYAKKSVTTVFKRQSARLTNVIIDVGKLVTERKGLIELRYHIKEQIGHGGYGEVRKVQDKVTGELLAMKTIPKRACADLNASSIATEIEILKKLDHPHIIKLYEFAQDDNNYYLITELCTGGELFDRITTYKNFTELVAAQIMKSILSAIAYCHSLNIVHRYFFPRSSSARSDLKPENLLFDTKGEDAVIKVVDFGTSKIFGRDDKMSQRIGTVSLHPERISRTTSRLRCSARITTKSATCGAAA